jgi:hypothetical protein
MSKGWNTSKREVGEFGKLLEEKVDCRNSYLFTIREVDTLERVVTLFPKTHYSLISKVHDLSRVNK